MQDASQGVSQEEGAKARGAVQAGKLTYRILTATKAVAKARTREPFPES